MITGKCDICGDSIKAATTQAQFNRNKGLHLRARHQKPGRMATPESRRHAARLRSWRRRGLSPAEIAEKERKYAAKYPDRQPATISPAGNAEPIAVHICPFCRGEFWGVRGAV